MIKKLLLTFMLLGISLPIFAQQVQVSRDELPDTKSTDSTAVLNNVLRQNQNAINSIGAYFNNNGVLAPSAGGTGVNLNTAGANNILIWDATNVGIGTLNPGTSGQFLKSQGAGSLAVFSALPVDPNTSNVLFSFSGSTDTAGYVSAATLTSAATANFTYWAVTNVQNSAYATVISSKWVKLTGVNTVTVWARIWSGAINHTANCKVSIGTATGNVSGTLSQVTPEWKSFTIDVSGLTNNTTYDVTVQLANTDAGAISVYLGSVIGIAS